MIPGPISHCRKAPETVIAPAYLPATCRSGMGSAPPGPRRCEMTREGINPSPTKPTRDTVPAGEVESERYTRAIRGARYRR